MHSFTVLPVLLFLFALVSAQRHQHAHLHEKVRQERATTTTPVTSSTSSTMALATNIAAAVSTGSCYYWLENIQHQGLAPFSSSGSSYQVFRNVKDFGAKGDGTTDDTAAINNAIAAGNRCGPYYACGSTTTTPALVYFPPGTYLVSTPIIDFYYTQLVGNPNCLPVIKATSNFAGIALIDGDPYGGRGTLSYGSTNVFWRQVRNLVIDSTNVPANIAQNGIHWPTGQATSLQNVVFNLNTNPGTRHVGLFIEDGSGGFMTDLVFNGGNVGASIGNQQFTMRNLTFNGCNTAIYQIHDWGWTYAGLTINNCQVGLDLTSSDGNGQDVGSVTLFDSQINNTPIGIKTAFTNPNGQYTNGSLVVENVRLNNVPTAILGPNGVVLGGSSGDITIGAYGQGHSYTPNGPNPIMGSIAPNNRPGGLLSGGQYYQRSKPQYQNLQASQFLSARSVGATGNGATDDTSALQSAITSAKAQGKILYLDAGDYKVTSTIYIPAGSVIVGEAYPVILASGSFFSNVNSPQPVVQIGRSGETGSIEWSDAIVSTQGATAGAILFEINLAAPGISTLSKKKRQATTTAASISRRPLSKLTTTTSPSTTTSSTTTSVTFSRRPLSMLTTTSSAVSTTSTTSISSTTSSSSIALPSGAYVPSGIAGLWDVHARIGGFAGSNLQLANCPTSKQATPPGPVNQNCIAAFLTMHVTKSATNIYLENVWLWVADHDVEDHNLTQITIYAGRGLLVESTSPLWLWGTAVEHHTLYQYQFAAASTVYMGQIQTETAYYQPNPPVLFPFSTNTAYSDPDFSRTCYATTGFNFTSSSDFTNTCSGYGLRILNSHSLLAYGAGLYSFFDNYSTTCSDRPNDAANPPYGCQTRVLSLEGSNGAVAVYNLMTVGAQQMVTTDGQQTAGYRDNLNVYPDGIAVFRIS